MTKRFTSIDGNGRVQRAASADHLRAITNPHPPIFETAYEANFRENRWGLGELKPLTKTAALELLAIYRTAGITASMTPFGEEQHKKTCDRLVRVVTKAKSDDEVRAILAHRADAAQGVTIAGAVLGPMNSDWDSFQFNGDLDSMVRQFTMNLPRYGFYDPAADYKDHHAPVVMRPQLVVDNDAKPVRRTFARVIAGAVRLLSGKQGPQLD